MNLMYSSDDKKLKMMAIFADWSKIRKLQWPP